MCFIIDHNRSSFSTLNFYITNSLGDNELEIYRNTYKELYLEIYVAYSSYDYLYGDYKIGYKKPSKFNNKIFRIL